MGWGRGRRGLDRALTVVFPAGIVFGWVVPIGLEAIVSEFQPMASGYEERKRAAGPPYQFLIPTADDRALEKIRGLLAREQKTFGGFLSQNFPMYRVMNARMGFPTHGAHYTPPTIDTAHCVFWFDATQDVRPFNAVNVVNAYRRQVAGLPGASCEAYQPKWKSAKQSLCYVCPK